MPLDYELQSRSWRVFNFYSSPSSYVAFCEDDMRLDIGKCRTYLPPDLDPADHYHYMWVQSLQGFFLLRQRIQGRLSGEWHVVAEVVAQEFSAYFFDRMWEDFAALLERLRTDLGL